MAKHVYGRVVDPDYHFGRQKIYRGQIVKMTANQAKAVKASLVLIDGKPQPSIEVVKFEDVKDHPFVDLTGGTPETADATAAKA